ncbi:MAG: hypothetical protein U0796_03705 [Gemmatales bacterium]
MFVLVLMLMPALDLVSGPQPGKKFGPYTFLMATGPNRGTSHCYVCETGDDPAIIILARSTSEPLGELARQVDKELSKQKKLRGWITFVGMPQPSKEPELVKWSRTLGLRFLPLGIFESQAGPPGYKLHSDADLTILLVKESKVVHNFAYPVKGLTTADNKKIVDLLNRLIK